MKLVTLANVEPVKQETCQIVAKLAIFLRIYTNVFLCFGGRRRLAALSTNILRIPGITPPGSTDAFQKSMGWF